ncbi:hypothetical protein [Streptomyces sp. NPDC001292]|uniref:hypothetical protein n=1 Tax=Streptomyces sp. NPDC001292 TaxID=3364558 RepID=UPI00367BF5EC
MPPHPVLTRAPAGQQGILHVRTPPQRLTHTRASSVTAAVITRFPAGRTLMAGTRHRNAFSFTVDSRDRGLTGNAARS